MKKNIAKLTDDQLTRIQQLEQELGIIIVAYEKEEKSA